MAKSKERLEAIKLRRGGESINIIAKKVNVSKSTVSLWCRDLNLTTAQRELLRKNAIAAGHRGRMIGAELNKKKKEELIDSYEKTGVLQLGKLSERDKLIAG